MLNLWSLLIKTKIKYFYFLSTQFLNFSVFIKWVNQIQNKVTLMIRITSKETLIEVWVWSEFFI